MASPGSILALWDRLAPRPGGKWLFSQLVCWRAPFFRTIRPRFLELRPGYCEVSLRKRRAVLNHIGTVHAIAMCNAAEICAGLMAEATIPPTHRWIPKSMTVEYLRKAETSLRSMASQEAHPAFSAAVEWPVAVAVVDAAGQTVLRAEIRLWVSPRQRDGAAAGAGVQFA